jgi:hypothetical protein
MGLIQPDGGTRQLGRHSGVPRAVPGVAYQRADLGSGLPTVDEAEPLAFYPPVFIRPG